MAENRSNAITERRKASTVTHKAKKKNWTKQSLYEIFFSALKKLANIFGAMTVE
jgi:hypothetical protein